LIDIHTIEYYIVCNKRTKSRGSIFNVGRRVKKMKKYESYEIYDIADFFIGKESMTPRKLQKLCYYAVAWGHALLNKSIVRGTQSEFQAWVHGPVSPLLYKKYRGNAWGVITSPERNLKLDEKTLDLLESVWMTYRELSANALEALSRTEIPWKRARAGCGDMERSTNVIDIEDMKECYCRFMDVMMNR
jgi:uncharacterized phage-associated protein